MWKKAVYNGSGAFMGYVYFSEGERFYAPARGVSDSELAGYCDVVLV